MKNDLFLAFQMNLFPELKLEQDVLDLLHVERDDRDLFLSLVRIAMS